MLVLFTFQYSMKYEKRNILHGPGISLSMVVRNSRDQPRKLWLLDFYVRLTTTLKQAFAENTNYNTLILLY